MEMQSAVQESLQGDLFESLLQNIKMNLQKPGRVKLVLLRVIRCDPRPENDNRKKIHQTGKETIHL